MKNILTYSIIVTILGTLLIANSDTKLNNVNYYTKEAKMYKNECSSCHMAYQAELLPKRSWIKLMSNLENHFKVDASLDKNDTKNILDYLTSNAGDTKTRKSWFIRSIKNSSTPLRISNIPAFKREHRFSKNYLKRKKIKTIGNCTACHTNAQQGIFEDD